MPPNGAISPAGFRRDDALVDADDAVFERLGDAPAGRCPGFKNGGAPMLPLYAARIEDLA
jgi:hypothetical protein